MPGFCGRLHRGVIAGSESSAPKGSKSWGILEVYRVMLLMNVVVVFAQAWPGPQKPPTCLPEEAVPARRGFPECFQVFPEYQDRSFWKTCRALQECRTIQQHECLILNQPQGFRVSPAAEKEGGDMFMFRPWAGFLGMTFGVGSSSFRIRSNIILDLVTHLLYLPSSVLWTPLFLITPSWRWPQSLWQP